MSAILAAIAKAIYDAVGVRLDAKPLIPEKILRGRRVRDGRRDILEASDGNASQEKVGRTTVEAV